MPAESAARSPHLRGEMWGTQITRETLAVGAGEQTANHESEGRDRGQGVVLLARGEGEEYEDEAGPEEEGEGGFAVHPTHPPHQRSWRGPRHVAVRLRHEWGT